MEIITAFRGNYRFLSNFWPAIVSLKDEHLDIKYPTVEHAYQAAKTLDRNIRLLISQLPTPGDAKRFTRDLEELRPGWEHIKLNVMTDLVRQKFTNNEELKKKLLDTTPSYLIEGNNWGDRFWGAVLHKSEPYNYWRGQNNLGKILMQIREELSDTDAKEPPQ